MNNKINLSFLLIPIFFLFLSCTKELKLDNKEQDNMTAQNVLAEEAFKTMDSLKSHFCDFPDECERYENYTFLEKRKFEENVTKNLMHLAQDFLVTYPNDRHYFRVLKYFFNLNFEPRFLVEKIPDSLTVFLSKEIPFGTMEYYKRLRSLPIDLEAQNEWLNMGYELAEKFLQTNEPLEKKLEIEIAVLARDFRCAYEVYNSLNKKRIGLESRYWKQFDKHFWEPFRLRMNILVKKYSELEVTATYVEQLISLVSQASPQLIGPYWKNFLELTNDDSTMSHTRAFEALRKKAEINLEELKNVDISKPLEMEFTTIDGTNINLDNLRGKVVLIDFWSIRCPPCIKEMPYVQTLYEKYRNQGFEVIGLAANGDNDKKRIVEIIEQQGATWPQCLGKSKDAKISYHSLYNINSYPTVWLLNKEGILVDKNARGNRLEPLIRMYLGLDN